MSIQINKKNHLWLPIERKLTDKSLEKFKLSSTHNTETFLNCIN